MDSNEKEAGDCVFIIMHGPHYLKRSYYSYDMHGLISFLYAQRFMAVAEAESSAAMAQKAMQDKALLMLMESIYSSLMRTEDDRDTCCTTSCAASTTSGGYARPHGHHRNGGESGDNGRLGRTAGIRKSRKRASSSVGSRCAPIQDWDSSQQREPSHRPAGRRAVPKAGRCRGFESILRQRRPERQLRRSSV